MVCLLSLHTQRLPVLKFILTNFAVYFSFRKAFYCIVYALCSVRLFVTLVCTPGALTLPISFVQERWGERGTRLLMTRTMLVTLKVYYHSMLKCSRKWCYDKEQWQALLTVALTNWYKLAVDLLQLVSHFHLTTNRFPRGIAAFSFTLRNGDSLFTEVCLPLIYFPSNLSTY